MIDSFLSVSYRQRNSTAPRLIGSHNRYLLANRFPGPGPANRVPGSANVVPGSANVVPGPANVVPGPANVVPGPANVVPGPANVVPGSANVVPGSANVVPGPGSSSCSSSQAALEDIYTKLLCKQRKDRKRKILIVRRSSVGWRKKALSQRKLCSIYSKFG